MKLDPRHLAQLSIIVESESFQAAAHRLGLTQPALSRNMSTLESRLGSSIFQRDGRRSRANDLGLRLARSGLAIRLAEEQAGSIADRHATGVIGELRIGAPPIVAGRFLTDPLSIFIQSHPQCSIHLRTGLVHELRTMLERGKIDVALGPQSLISANKDLEFTHLIDDRVGILCKRDHKLVRQKKIIPKDLEEQIWIAHSSGSMLRQQTEAAMIACGVTTIQIGLETDSIRTVLEVVSNTDMITSMPRATTSPYLEDKLVFLNFDHPQFKRPLGAIRRKDTPVTPVESDFLKQLRLRN